jgi:putative tryptophan/tyrosine transport system substrate-binding protein
MSKTVRLWLLAIFFLATVSLAEAQQLAKIPRVGFLRPVEAEESYVEAFRQGLKELGYVEGKNIALEYRSGNTDQLPKLAGELVGLQVAIILADGSSPALAAKHATSKIPIVMTTSTDPVGTGLIASLARPGGNITGLASNSQELGGKNLALLKEIVPRLARVVIPTPGSSADDIYVEGTEAPARALGVQLIPVIVRGAEDYEGVFRVATQKRANGLLSRLQPRTSSAARKQFVELVAKSRLPAVYVSTNWVETGGLMSYGPERIAMYRRAATYVDKILKGAKPADLPVEQPTKFEFVINLKTAKQIGLTIPPNVLGRADRIIK